MLGGDETPNDEATPSPPPSPPPVQKSPPVSPIKLEKLVGSDVPEPPPLPEYLKKVVIPPLPPLPRCDDEVEMLDMANMLSFQLNPSKGTNITNGNRKSSEGGIISPALDSGTQSCVDFNLHDDIYDDDEDQEERGTIQVSLPTALQPKDPFVPTPYAPQELFNDSDNRCGNALNRFYSLRDITWYAVWKHIGTTRSTYNLRSNPLWIIPKTSFIRITAIKIVDSAYFRWAVLSVIILNAFALALDIPETKDYDGVQDFLHYANIIFLVAFTIEMVMKVVAMGFLLNVHSYLSSPWNALDFALLLAGYTSLHPSVANFTVVRLVRLLRPLRTISRVPGLSALLSALFGAVPHMANILLLISFLLTIFSIVGVQLWESSWDNRCYALDESTMEHLLISNSTRGCSIGTHFYGALSCSESENGVTLNQTCMRNTSQFHESTLNFDNFASASLLAFKIISLDDWPVDLKRTQDAFGWWTWLYFFFLTVCGSFVCVNLMLAAMTMVLEQERNEDKKRGAQEEVKSIGSGSPRMATPLELQLTVRSDTTIAKIDSEAFTHDAKGKKDMGFEGSTLVDVPSGIRVTNIAVSTVTFSLMRLPTAVYLSACLRDPEWKGNNIGSKGNEDCLSALRSTLHRVRRSSVTGSQTSTSPIPNRTRLRRSHTKQHVMFAEYDIPHLDLTAEAADDEVRRQQAEQLEAELQDDSYRIAPPSPTRKTLYKPHGDAWVTEGAVLRMGGAGSKVATKPLSYWRNVLRAVTTSKYVSRYMLFITCFNVTVLCTDAHGISEEREQFIETTNFVCNIHFMAELVLKLAAMGWSEYLSDNFNKCDFLLVLISIPEMVLAKGSAASAVRAVRLFRLARILRVGARLLPRLQSLRVILVTVMASLREAGYIMLVMLLLIFIYTIIGIQLFANSLPEDARNNFNSLWEGALTVFVIISGERWGRIMKTAIDSTSAASAVYFVSLFILGNYILLNLFTSVIIFNFKNWQDHEEGGDATITRAAELASSSSLLRTKMARTVLANQSDADQPFSTPAGRRNTHPDDLTSATTSGATADLVTSPSSGTTSGRRGIAPLVLDKHDSHGRLTSNSDTKPSTDVSEILSRQTSGRLRTTDKSVSMLTERAPVSELTWVEDWGMHGKEMSSTRLEKQTTDTTVASQTQVPKGVSLGIFPPDHPFRMFLAKFVFHKQFDNAISVLIVLNCVTIALSDPWWDSDDTRKLALDICDYIFTALFIVEMCAKIIVYGLWEKYELEEDIDADSEEEMDNAAQLIEREEENQPYLQCTWNKIDLFVVCVAVVGLFVKQFRIFRSFRAIRLVIRSENIKIVVLALLHALPTMGNVVMVILFLFIVFSAVGIQLFKGTLWHCTDIVSNKEQCNGTYYVEVIEFGATVLEEREKVWQNSRTNFDHLGYAMLTLFELALGEGWVDIMFQGIDSQDPGDGRRVNARPYNALFYVMFVMVGSFFAMNLFIGMLVDKFSEITRYYNGHIFLTPQQVTWVQTAKVLHRAKIAPKPKMPSNPIQCVFFHLVGHPWFDPFITLCILINVVAMMVVHRGQSDEFTAVLEMVNLVLLCVYTAEAGAKIVAWGPAHYAGDKWNKFDLLIVVVSWLGFGLLNSSLASVFRMLRVGRMFRLVNKANGIRQMLFTLYYSLPPLLNLSLLLMVVLFVYGAIGVELFGKVKQQKGLDEHLNFSSMPKAIVTLFIISTAETWPDVMEACRYTPDTCTDDCGTEWAVPYFISFMMVGYVISLNLFITIIIEVLEHQRSQIELLNTVDSFKYKWMKFDIDANERLTWRQLLMILRVLPPPVGMPLQAKEVSNYLTSLRIPISYEGHVRYIDAVYGIARVSMSMEAVEARQLADKGFTGGPLVSGIVISLHHMYFVTLVQKWWRVTKMKRLLNQTVLEVTSPRSSKRFVPTLVIPPRSSFVEEEDETGECTPNEEFKFGEPEGASLTGSEDDEEDSRASPSSSPFIDMEQVDTASHTTACTEESSDDEESCKRF